MTEEDEPIEFTINESIVELEKMSEVELKHRLYGGVQMGKITSRGIRGYNAYHLKHGQPWHCVTIQKLKEMLLNWGVEETRAEKLSKEVGYAK